MAETTATEIVQTEEERRVANVIASQELEGLKTPPEEQAMLLRLSRGEIGFADYERWAKSTYLR